MLHVDYSIFYRYQTSLQIQSRIVLAKIKFLHVEHYTTTVGS